MAIKIKRKLQCLALVSAASMTTIPAYAADEALLDMLLQNGAINQAQYDVLIEKESVSQKDLDDVQVKLNSKGLQFQTADKQYQFKIGGRIHADATFHGNDRLSKGGTPVEAADGTELRRARMYFKGLLWDDFKFVTEVDFADNNVAVKDMFLTYVGVDWLELTLGHQKHAISMEVQESSNDIMFTERSMVYGLTVPHFDRAIGVNLKTKGHDWSAQVGAYGDSVTPNDAADEGWGLGSRVTYTPINTKHEVIHLGAYAGFRKPNEVGHRQDKAKPFELEYEAAHMSSLKLSDTGGINNVSSYTLGGLEAAAMYGPFSVQGEYARSWVDTDKDNNSAGNTYDFDAWYIQAGWTLTGESRSYKGSDGEFKRLKAAKPFSLKEGGGWGAVELAARYDTIDLNSDDEHGGRESAVTVALNWYLNDNVRLMADYRRVIDLDRSAITEFNGDQVDDLDMFTLRTQLAF